MYAAICKGCEKIIVSPHELILDPEIRIIVRHIRECHRQEPLAENAQLEEVLHRVEVTPLDGVRAQK
jgi:hypothetical protein